MIRPLTLALLAFLPSLVLAAEDALPAGVEVGKKLYSLPPSATTLEEAGWIMKGEGDAVVGSQGISITSGEQNPFLWCLTELEGDILVRMRISCDPSAPNVIKILCFNRVGVEYNSSLKQFALLENTDTKKYPDPTKIPFEASQVKKGTLESFGADPADFVITMAITQQKVMVWCGNLLLFSSPLTEFDPLGQLRVRSGWKSNWTMSAVDVFKLEKLPQF